MSGHGYLGLSNGPITDDRPRSGADRIGAIRPHATRRPKAALDEHPPDIHRARRPGTAVCLHHRQHLDGNRVRLGGDARTLLRRWEHDFADAVYYGRAAGRPAAATGPRKAPSAGAASGLDRSDPGDGTYDPEHSNRSLVIGRCPGYIGVGRYTSSASPPVPHGTWTHEHAPSAAAPALAAATRCSSRWSD
jgi:hypothetical protein